MIQLHKILIGIVLVGLISAGMMLFLNEGVTSYSVTGYNNTSMQSFIQLDELSTQVEQFNDEDEGVEDTGVLDILGSFFTNMYQSAKIFKNSADVVGTMVDESVTVVDMGGYSGYLKKALGLMVMIVIFVAIFLAFVTKSERT
jgi:hypothetical protein